MTPSASGRGHLLAQMMIGGEYAVITGQIDARVGHECRQPDDEIRGLEHDMRGAIPIRRLQSVVNVVDADRQMSHRADCSVGRSQTGNP